MMIPFELGCFIDLRARRFGIERGKVAAAKP